MREMESHGEQTHYTKRVVLPSGKTIEVVYFKDQDEPRAEQPEAHAPEHAPAEVHQDLHVCIDCASELVYPVQWDEAGPENWNVLLHCPNCDVYREELDRGGDALARDYKRLMRANMAEEI